jgi:serine/threonine-protein kinase
MDASRWTEIKDHLAEALDLDGPDRTAYLRRLNDDLRAEVSALLAAAETDDVLDRPLASGLLPAGIERAPRSAPPTRDAEPAPLVGARVGPYRVEALAGRGGMGDVYRARRADGLFDREVALKLVRTDADALLARFAAERQILGALDHPGIARLIGAGAEAEGPAAGRPWLALEFVRGEPVTEAARRLGRDARLRLMADVADAVEHAHRRLVVHRDLKPSNVLVTGGEDGPRAKLLDFGIAKILDPETAPDLTSLDGRRPMTRGYAAPEQVRGGSVTTATDVYGLGVLLYEVLTGARPFPVQSPRALEEAILAGRPPRPSAASRPEAGGLDPRTLRGDLDLVVQTAMAADPDARYPSAAALAADLRRVLAREPIAARRPSLGYRARRFVARHRTGVALAVAALAAVAVGLAAHTARLADERDRAEEALAEAQALGDTQDRLLRVLEPSFRAEQDSADAGEAPPLAEVLDQTVEEVEDAYAESPAALARSLVSLGETAFARGQRARADSLFARALALRQPLGREGDPVVYAAFIGRGHAARDGGDRAAARRHFRRALAIERAHPDVTEYSRDSSVEMFLAAVLDDAGDRERGLLRTLAERRAADPPAPVPLAQAHNALGVHYFGAGRYREALAELRAAERLAAGALGDRHPGLVSLRQNIAFALSAIGRYEEAGRYARVALETARAAEIGPVQENRIVAVLGHTQLYLGQTAEAERTIREALAIAEADGPTSKDVRDRLFDLAAVLAERGRVEQALATIRRQMRATREAGMDDTPAADHVRAFEAALRYAVGERAEAAAALRRLAREAPTADDQRLVRAAIFDHAGRVLVEEGDAEAAVPLLREALDANLAAHPDSPYAVARARLHYGRALAVLGRVSEARPHLEAARGHVPSVSFPAPLDNVDAEIDRLLAGR